MEGHLLSDILILLVAAVAVVALFGQLRLSPVLGYIVAGAAIGPHGLAFIAGIEETRALAELGVVLMLFMIGLELSYERLLFMRRYVLNPALAQVAVTALAIAALALWLGEDAPAAIVIGVGLALSSTAIVIQLLVARGEQTTQLGRVSIAVLIAQDVLVVPMLVLIPLFGDEVGTLLSDLGVAAIKAAAVLAAIVVIGRLVLHHVFHLVARGKQAELLTATALLIILGTATVTAWAGLSLALGAFVAGLLVAECEYRHEVAADITPFRGLLVGLFFMTVGMAIDLTLLVERLPTVLLVVVALVATKAAILTALARLAGLSKAVSVRTGLLLAQGGEFTFILFTLAVAHGVMAPATAELLIVAVAMTMALTPALGHAGRMIARRLIEADATRHEGLAEEVSGLDSHVLIAGFGRVGQTVAGMLAAGEVPYVALDLEAGRVREGRAEGVPVFYADASRDNVLRAAGVERACAAVVTLDTPEIAVRAVAALRRANPDMAIYARARDRRDMERLDAAGASVVVPETLEASLQLGGQVLSFAGMPEAHIDRLYADLRREGYGRLAKIIPAPTREGPATPPGDDEGRTGGG
jgi:CPA2 family monovalent cation:H+ antiporter-2